MKTSPCIKYLNRKANFKNRHSFQYVNFFPFEVCYQNPIIEHCGNTPGPTKLNIGTCLSNESSFQCKLLCAITRT